jgi:hypothetical protein
VVGVISVYFTIRNTLPKSGTFLLGHLYMGTEILKGEQVERDQQKNAK